MNAKTQKKRFMIYLSLLKNSVWNPDYSVKTHHVLKATPMSKLIKAESARLMGKHIDGHECCCLNLSLALLDLFPGARMMTVKDGKNGLHCVVLYKNEHGLPVVCDPAMDLIDNGRTTLNERAEIGEHLSKTLKHFEVPLENFSFTGTGLDKIPAQYIENEDATIYLPLNNRTESIFSIRQESFIHTNWEKGLASKSAVEIAKGLPMVGTVPNGNPLE